MARASLSVCVGLTLFACATPPPKPPPEVAPKCELSESEVHDACASTARDVTSDELPVFSFKSLPVGTPDSDVEQILGDAWACEHQKASWSCTRRGALFPHEIGLAFNQARLESIQALLPCAAGSKETACEQYSSYVRELRKHLGAPAAQVDGVCAENIKPGQPRKAYASWKHGTSRLCLVIRGSLKGPNGASLELSLESEGSETHCRVEAGEQ